MEADALAEEVGTLPDAPLVPIEKHVPAEEEAFDLPVVPTHEVATPETHIAELAS